MSDKFLKDLKILDSILGALRELHDNNGLPDDEELARPSSFEELVNQWLGETESVDEIEIKRLLEKPLIEFVQEAVKH